VNVVGDFSVVPDKDQFVSHEFGGNISSKYLPEGEARQLVLGDEEVDGKLSVFAGYAPGAEMEKSWSYPNLLYGDS